MTSCTVITPINIAVIKYWGKKSFEQNIPLNDSISATISTKLMNTKTTITLDPNLETSEFWLNGKLQNEFFESERFKRCEAAILEMASLNPMVNRKYSIKTVNSFPTGAGLASSASGYCALVLALAKIHGLAIDSETDRRRLSAIARLGSGSACRSLFGGWVKWTTVTSSSTSTSTPDSYAHQLYPQTIWPQLKLLVLIVDERMKKTGSTQAMIRSGQSSDFLTYRNESIVNAALDEIECAIGNRDFAKFARLVIRDSNRLHAICLDTYPPVFYMNDTSFRIVDFVCDFNRRAGGENCEKVAYTFDAGPNAFLFVEEENFDLVLGDLLKIFPKPSNFEWPQYLLGLDNYDSSNIDKYLQLKATSSVAAGAVGCATKNDHDPKLKMIIVTEIGSGPYFENN